MANYSPDEIRKAVKILGLTDTATISGVKDHFKKLITRWHPDKCEEHPEKCKAMSQQINQAYKVLMKYCFNYEISFRKEDVEKTMAKDDENWWYTRFGDDPIWGK